jgi:hypothetical protein
MTMIQYRTEYRTLEVRDERQELSPRIVARHTPIPDGWTPAQILEYFGVSEHLRAVLIHPDGERQVIQEGW